MANSRTGILSSIIPALIFSFIFYSCKSETAVEPPPAKYGIQGKVTDDAGAALSNVSIWLTYYYTEGSNNSAGLNKASLSKISSTSDYPFKLYQNFPNPVLYRTFFRFSIPSEGEVSFKITDKLTNEVLYSYSDNLIGGLYQMERNLRDSLKLKNGIYRYTVNFKSKTGETFSDTKELLLVCFWGNPSTASDAEGNYFLSYNSIFAGDTVVVKPDEYSQSEQVLGNEVYLQFEKEGYYTTPIKASLAKDILLEKNIIMRKFK